MMTDVSGPPAAVAAIRLAVRGVLGEATPGDLVLVACSGGADSLALLAATAFEGPKLGVRVGMVVVDHQLQSGSGGAADTVLRQAEAMGVEPRVRVNVEVRTTGAGPEADARAVRYGALTHVAADQSVAMILLGHTRDDQSEQVLLGLTRGSGTRSLSGMPRSRGVFHRPLLDITRSQTRTACLSDGLTWWEDPQNSDPAFTRVRIRQLLSSLEDTLGPGIGAALARSADQLRDDSEYLESIADLEALALGPGPWSVAQIEGLPRAIRTRVWRSLLIAAGAPAGQVSALHTDECDRLVTDWHGQGPVSAPGPLSVTRSGDRVSIDATTPVE